MSWALAVVAPSLIGFGVISRRVDGTSLTPADPWEALIVSRSFAWSDFVYGGEDALCGIFASGLFSEADLPRTGHATS